MKPPAPFLARVFWPESVRVREDESALFATSGSGFIVGWNVSEFTCCVLSLVDSTELRVLLQTLERLANDPALEELRSHCAGPPILLGEWSDGVVARRTASGSTLAHRQNANLWLEAVVPRDGVARPRLRSVYCCGCPFKTSTHIIFYRRPDASRFHRYVVGTAASASAFTCRTVQRKQMQLSQGEDLGAVVQKAAVRGGRQPTDMHYVMNEINSAQQFLRLVKDSVDNRKRRLNRPLRQASMASLPRHLFLTVALALRTVLGATLALLGARLPKGFPGIGGSSLRSTSVFFQQLDLRIRDICSWPLLYRELLRLRRLRRPMVRAGEIEMRLMSSVACVALDLALGIALTAYLAIHAGAAAELPLSVVRLLGQVLHHEVLRSYILWLMDIPAGLKLNSNLNSSLGSTLLATLDLWNRLMGALKPLSPIVVRAAAYLGVGGITMLVAFVIDLTRVVTNHIYLLWSIFSKIHADLLSILLSLLKLFTGKKQNVLRRRMDTYKCDANQLLLGTIFFAVLFFLAPTLGVYYVFFTVVWCGVLCTQGALWLALASLNAFPVYALLRYVADPGRFPGGVAYEIMGAEEAAVANGDLRAGDDGEGRQGKNVSYFRLRLQRAPIGTLFRPFVEYSSRIARHYSLTTLSLALLLGRHFPPVPNGEVPLLTRLTLEGVFCRLGGAGWAPASSLRQVGWRQRRRKCEANEDGESEGRQSDGASEGEDEFLPIPTFAEFAHLVTATPEEYAEAFVM